MYYVYIGLCSDDSLYTGFTNNLERRFKAHNEGKGAKYTRSRLPVKLLYYESFIDKSSALKRECQIKSLSHAEKFQLINKK